MVGSSGSSSAGLLVVGLVFVVYGLAALIGAVTDYRGWLTTMYENNKNRKTGFGAISNSSVRYRVYVGLSGAVAVILGIMAVANS